MKKDSIFRDSPYPKVEAAASIYVFLTPPDIACGVRNDCRNCAVAQAIRRCVGRDDAEAEIYQSVAYVLMPLNEETIRHNGGAKSGLKAGELAVHRFRVNPTLGKQILAFDHSGVADPAGYCFRAITPSQRLEHKRSGGKYAHPKATKRKPQTPIAARATWVRARGPFARNMAVTFAPDKVAA